MTRVFLSYYSWVLANCSFSTYCVLMIWWERSSCPRAKCKDLSCSLSLCEREAISASFFYSDSLNRVIYLLWFSAIFDSSILIYFYLLVKASYRLFWFLRLCTNSSYLAFIDCLRVLIYNSFLLSLSYLSLISSDILVMSYFKEVLDVFSLARLARSSSLAFSRAVNF